MTNEEAALFGTLTGLVNRPGRTDMDHETIICLRCGAEVQRTGPAQKYCPDCAPVIQQEKRRIRDAQNRADKKRPVKRSAENNVKLSKMAAEAAQHHMTHTENMGRR